MSDMQNPASIKPAGSSTEFEIPSDVVTLPSKGLVYPKGSPLFGKENLQLQYLTAIQEDIITSPNLIQTGKMISALLKSVIKDRSVNVDELILGDRNTLLVWLRTTGYGGEYPVRLQCSECNATFEHEFNLAELDIKELEVEPDENGLFTFTLPVSKKIVKFKFLNGEDELDILKTTNSRKKKLQSQVDNSLSLRMFKVIKEVNGMEDQNQVRQFVSTMIAKDSRAFRNYMQSIEPGMIMKQDATCTSCGNVAEEVVPIQANFFWPDSES